MKFVTRKHVKVDRVACPWLITRFVDAEAEFLFVEPGDVVAVAEREGGIPFDVPNVELGHRGPLCSFDAVLTKYNITAPGMERLARIVRGADTDAKGLEPESYGLEAAAEGFRAIGKDDHDILRLEFPLYDALYAYCRAKEGKDQRGEAAVWMLSPPAGQEARRSCDKLTFTPMPERPPHSAKPVAQKLGIKPGHIVLVLSSQDAPGISDLPAGMELAAQDATGVDAVVAFVRNRAQVETIAPRALAAVKPGGLLWFAYPKKSAMKTDISRDAGWDAVHAGGWEGVAMVAIDDTWSAMRFRRSADVKNSRFRS